MSCSGCGRELTGRPNAICPNVIHWQAWSERLNGVIDDANGALMDSTEHDVEHKIACHADTLPTVLRSVAAGNERAIEILQVIIQERFE